MAELSGLVAVVTGTSGPIGAGIARTLISAGASVLAQHRTGANLVDEAVAVRADLRDPAAVDVVMRTAVEEFGGLDVLVNNAGVQPVQSLPEMSVEQWREMFAGNADTTFLATRAAARIMIERGTGGSIISIASIEATTPAVGHAHYAASKAAILMHTKAAALEYGPHRIRVNAVSPGLITRPGIEQQWPDGVRRWQDAAPLTRLGTPEDVGNACAFLASDRAMWITGQNLVVDGGMSAHPAW